MADKYLGEVDKLVKRADKSSVAGNQDGVEMKKRSFKWRKPKDTPWRSPTNFGRQIKRVYKQINLKKGR